MGPLPWILNMVFVSTIDRRDNSVTFDDSSLISNV